MACHHQRSASLPSFPSYSIESSLEQELQTLKSHTISSPSATTIDAACDGLRRLGDVYTSVEEMTRLPSTQAGLCSAKKRKAVEKELDMSLELIDLCSAMQESLAEMKTCVQEARLVLKRGDDAAAQVKVESFVRVARKAQKPLMKKTTASCSNNAAAGGGGGEGCRVVRVMAEARETAVSMLESTSRMLPKQIGGGAGASKWSLVSRRFQRRKSVVVCEEQQLQALERGVGDLEEGVEFLFRRLIQSRVSLLNVLSS
ncbi:hypothetical protein EJB05_29340, partial [Eragrostis curvula]